MPDAGEPTVAEVEEFLLQHIDRNLHSNIGVGRNGFVAAVAHVYGSQPSPPPNVVAEAVWKLVGKGLVYIDFSNDSGFNGGNHADAKNWFIRLTQRGREFQTSAKLPDPDLPDKYLQSFVQAIPDVSDAVRLYINEALETYNNRNYIASAVMLGVAAEAAFLEMADGFCHFLPNTEAERLREYLNHPKSKYSAMLDEFRKRFEVRKGDFPPEMSDKIDLQLNGILELIRTYRNDSGHPTGFQMGRAECHQALVAFAHTGRQLYALKNEFEARVAAGGGT
ncbi:MAG: hypothetical protein HYV26_13005 [Candidatus Hydrogenedentes bacterium]|nr:hypothetical protein [Candidatus Hydrogenedentota bacterium]